MTGFDLRTVCDELELDERTVRAVAAMIRRGDFPMKPAQTRGDSTSQGEN